MWVWVDRACLTAQWFLAYIQRFLADRLGLLAYMQRLFAYPCKRGSS